MKYKVFHSKVCLAFIIVDDESCVIGYEIYARTNNIMKKLTPKIAGSLETLPRFGNNQDSERIGKMLYECASNKGMFKVNIYELKIKNNISICCYL